MVIARYWLPVFLWMLVIFLMSTDIGSGGHTSRILGPLVRWLMPGAPASTLDQIHFLVRKGGHLTEYAILGLLIWRALVRPRWRKLGGWHWKPALLAVGISAAYAAGDEFHQSFVPSRGASVRDVMIDSCGAAMGMLVLWVFVSRRRRPDAAGE